MASLNIQHIPDDLYDRVQRRAGERHRSLDAEVVALLQQALDDEQGRADQAALLREIRARRWTPPQGTPTSLELLREDRGR
jgi:plasmid stability protein